MTQKMESRSDEYKCLLKLCQMLECAFRILYKNNVFGFESILGHLDGLATLQRFTLEISMSQRFT